MPIVRPEEHYREPRDPFINLAIPFLNNESGKKLLQGHVEPIDGWKRKLHRYECEPLMQFGLIIYAVPAILPFIFDATTYRHVLSFISISIGVALFYAGSDLYKVERNSPEQPPSLDDVGLKEQAIEKILVDYQVTVDEARFYDRHIKRTTYLSLATVGIIAAISRQVPYIAPGLAMFGSVAHFLFAIAISSHIEVRDELWGHQREIEEHEEFEGKLVVRRTSRPRKNRGFFSKFSFSKSSLAMHRLLLLFWIGAYYVTALDIF